MDEQILQETQEIQDAITKIKPEWSVYHGKHYEGKGFVKESIFVVQRHRIVWVVLLFSGTFAYKELMPEWLEVFASLVTESPRIFVEYDKYHRIKEWVATQDKVLPVETP